MGAEAGIYLTPPGGGQTLRDVTLLDSSTAGLWVRGPETRSRHDADDSVGAAPAGAIKAVLFDAENVLYDASGWYRWLAQIFARIEPRTLEAEFLRSWRERLLPLVERGEREFHVAFAEGLRAIGLAAAHIEEIVAASRAQRRRKEGSLRTLPGVRSTLSNLHSAGIELGILANIDKSAPALANDLARLGIAGFFTRVVTSLDLGASLPERRCYEAALAAMNLTACDVLFVGNEAGALRGAQGVGLRAVAFNARENVGDVGNLDRFEDLCALVTHPNSATPIR